jgi:hypothetical protein
MKSGNLNFLEPSGPLQACIGTADSIIIIITIIMWILLLCGCYFMQNCISFIVCISQRMPHLRIQHFNMQVRKVAKNTYHYLKFVCPSVHMYQLGLLWVDLLEILYWRLSFKNVEKNKAWLQSDKNTDHFPCITYYVFYFDWDIA